MCTGNAAKASQKSAAYQQAQIDLKFQNDSALYYNKEVAHKLGSESNLIGYSRGIGDATEKALDFAANARASKAINYAEFQRRNQFQRGSQLNRSRTAGRNQFLALAAQNRQIEYGIKKTFGIGLDKNRIAQDRMFSSRRSKTLAKLGFKPLQPLRVPHPGHKRDWSKLKMALSIAAGVATGGKSLALTGLFDGGGGGDGAGDLLETGVQGVTGGQGGNKSRYSSGR